MIICLALVLLPAARGGGGDGKLTAKIDHKEHWRCAVRVACRENANSIRFSNRCAGLAVTGYGLELRGRRNVFIVICDDKSCLSPLLFVPFKERCRTFSPASASARAAAPLQTDTLDYHSFGAENK